MVDQIESQVLAKHNMNRDDYEASVAERVDKNEELKAIEEYMIETMNRAGTGSIVLPKIAIPDALTPLKVFELLVISERSKIQKVAGVFVEYIRKGTMPNEMDPEFNMKMEEAMADNVEIPGLDELNLGQGEHHPLALFMMSQNIYTQNNKSGFKDSLQQFMHSVQMSTAALATGQLNTSNVDGFMQRLSILGDAEIQRFKDKLNPPKVVEVIQEKKAEVKEETKIESIIEQPEEVEAEIKEDNEEKKEEDEEKKEDEKEEKKEDEEEKKEDEEDEEEEKKEDEVPVITEVTQEENEIEHETQAGDDEIEPEAN